MTPDEVLLPPETLRRIGIERVVFSGGEPILHRQIDSVLKYYRDFVPERVIITNGLLLDEHRRRGLMRAGATGFAFSVDSLTPERYRAARGLKERQLGRVLANLASAALDRDRERLEVGLNVVVTRANASWLEVDALLGLANDLDLAYVKFQPLFNDGFVGKHAPWLMLDPCSADEFEQIAENISRWQGVSTNSPAFWLDLAILARGGTLPGPACELGSHTVLVVQGRIAQCYWVPDADVGCVSSMVTTNALTDAESRLNTAKQRCRVETRCFCLQGMQHHWSNVDAV